MKTSNSLLVAVLFLSVAVACENRDVNEGERFRPRELHDNFSNSHFTKVTVDGVEYIMMERDNNNPHEGFGFMAFRANKLIEKNDTAIAYLKTINEFQTRIYAKLYGIPLQKARALNSKILNENLFNEKELTTLEQNKLYSDQVNTDSLEVDY